MKQNDHVQTKTNILFVCSVFVSIHQKFFDFNEQKLSSSFFAPHTLAYNLSEFYLEFDLMLQNGYLSRFKMSLVMAQSISYL